FLLIIGCHKRRHSSVMAQNAKNHPEGWFFASGTEVPAVHDGPANRAASPAWTSHAKRLELVVQADAGFGTLQVLDVADVLGIGRVGVQTGALGQGVHVVQLVGADVASVVAPLVAVVQVGRGVVPAGVQGTARQRSAQANVVVVGLEVVGQIVELRRQRDASQTIRTVPAHLAMTVLAVGQTQLHDFEVVGAVDLPGGGGIVALHSLALTIIAGADTDRAVGVQGTHGHARTTIIEGGAIRVTTNGGARSRLATNNTGIVIGPVHQDGLEAGQVGRDILEGVVDAGAFTQAGRTEDLIGIAQVHTVRHQEGVDAGGVLATHREGTPVVAGQTHEGLAMELTAGSRATVTQVEALFQLEDGAQAVAQIFGALQTETVAVEGAVTQARGLGGDISASVVVLVVLVAVAGIQDTVQRHGRFCLSNASGGKAGQQSRSEQRLFHVRTLRRFV